MLANYIVPIHGKEATITITGKKLELEDFDALLEFLEICKKQFKENASEDNPAAA